MSTAVRVAAPRTRSRTMARASKRCKDCEPDSKRPAPHPGPRCATHHRERKKEVKRLAYYRWIKKTYGITGEQYEALYEAQGGTCAICRRARGTSKRLAVDHDHATGFVRGLLCSTCNNILGYLRDQADLAYGIGRYLENPPAFTVIGKVKPSV